MAQQTVPEAVLRFVRRHIHSVSQLEVLLLLARRRQAWTAAAVAIELRLTPRLAQIRLRDLHARGLCSHSPANDAYTYSPPPAVQAVISELAACYVVMQHSVIAIIYAEGGDADELDERPRAAIGPEHAAASGDAGRSRRS